MASLSASDDAGKLLLRLAVGVLVLMDGTFKVVNGPGSVMASLAKAGLPASIACLAYLGEVAAPVLTIPGLRPRPVALVVAINMLVAVGLVHLGQLAQLTRAGGWNLRLRAMYFSGAAAVALLGAGRYRVGGANGRWN